MNIKIFLKRNLFVLILILGLTNCKKNQEPPCLKEVDEALENVDIKQAIALQAADSIAMFGIKNSDEHEKISGLIKASKAYKHIDLEKSLYYLQEACRLCQDGTTPSDSIKVMIQLASLYNTEGLMVKEAADIYSRLEMTKIPADLRRDYFILGVRLNQNLADRNFDNNLKRFYATKASSLMDSVLDIEPKNVMMRANKMIESGNIYQALEFMKNEGRNSNKSNWEGRYYHYLAGLYKQLEMPDSQIFYLAKAAADDLNRGIREYKALTELAEELSPTDLKRAHRYISQSMSDANQIHSSRRQSEIAPIYNRINQHYQQKQKHFTMNIIFLTVSLWLIIVLILFSLIALKKKNKILSRQRQQLIESKEELDKTNQELEKMNCLLAEEGKIKSRYIHSFMELCLSYLAKMERFRAKMGKIASGGDLSKVVKVINSSRYVNEEISEFYSSFDQAFLSLYPNFITTLNSLLKSDQRYDEINKLSTELRIYALIWLGFESSGEIARFLRCSESTVYNYRTQMRNKAFNRESFESEFFKARSPIFENV